MSWDDTTADVIVSLKRSLDNPVTRHILKYLSKGGALEKALGIFAGTEHETCVRCKFNSFLLGTAIRGIGEYGVTKPQKLHAPFLVVWNYTKA
ncbi:MAG: hypothetical protein OCU18_07200, partial [Candidatus Syntrophoarchaeum sp.]|nr:hypothetical protein [Candidatus Syntrophoarchaeum sp.]